MARSLAEKLGIKDGMRAHLVPRAQETLVDLLPLSGLEVVAAPQGEFDYLHLFTTTQAELASQLARLRPHLRERGMLWVSWPKSRQLGTDLTLPEVIRIGYDAGLVESTTLSVDATWSAIKFTRPKPGKTYHNSYGRLPYQR